MSELIIDGQITADKLSVSSLTLSPEIQSELDYLRWFYDNADFGPADGDVRHYLNEQYVSEGGKIPAAYQDEE